jgi:hypothetical protein
MMKRPSLIICVALLLLSPQRSLLGGDRAGPRDARTVEATGEKTAANDQGPLTPQGVVDCSASDQPPEADDPATTSAIPRAERFIAQDHFRETASSTRGAVQITWVGAMFRERFLNKIEEGVGRAVLRRFVLRRSSRSADIVADLSIYHETKLADLWCLLSRQPGGGAGRLLINAVPNVFYIRDTEGVLAAVDAVWGGAGWEIGASSVDGSHLWPAGSQVIVR